MEKLKFLFKGIQIENENKIEKEFLNLVDTDIDFETVKRATDTNEDFVMSLKPLLIDSLKRCFKLSTVRDFLIDLCRNDKNLSNEKKQMFRKIQQRDLICALIETVPRESQPQFGVLISRNDYPVPIMYPIFDSHSDSHQIYKINSDLFRDLIFFSKKKLAINSGTKHSVKKGKSSSIPLFFPGIHSIMPPCDYASVEIYCNEESNSEWIVVDFNGETESEQATELMRIFSRFSSVHIFSVCIQDFDDKEEYEPNEEIKRILELYTDNKLPKGNLRKVILLLKDFDTDNDDSEILKRIEKRIFKHYDQKMVNVIGITNFKDCDDCDSEKRKIAEDVNAFIKAESDCRKVDLKMISESAFDLYYEFIKLNNQNSDGFDKFKKNVQENFYSSNFNCTALFPLTKVNRDLIKSNRNGDQRKS